MRVYGTTFDITLINNQRTCIYLHSVTFGRHLAGIDPINDRDYQ